MQAIVLGELAMATERAGAALRNRLQNCRRRSIVVQRCQRTGVAPTPYIRLYLGPLPPSRGVHLGPSTSVALQSTQFGAFTRRAPCVIRGLAVDAVRGVHAQGALRHLVHSR